MDVNTDQNQDAKLQIILQAAFDTFAKYGVKRTSMADIAERAGMSRAALYLHFKNKNDILQSLIAGYYQKSCTDVAQALSRGGALSDQITAGFQAQSGAAFRALLDSPHGAEIMDAKSKAREVIEAGNASLIRVYADWLSVQADCGRLAYGVFASGPDQVAEVMLDALEGLKLDVPSYETYAARRDMLARMFAKALTP